MRAISFAKGPLQRAQAIRPITQATKLGKQLAEELKG